MLYSLVLAVILSLLVHLVSSCCLDWILPGESEEKPNSTTGTGDKAKAAECDLMAGLQYWEDRGLEVLQTIVDPLRIFHQPVAPTQQSPSPADGAGSGATNKEKPTAAGG